MPYPRTKIVCTLGPSTASRETLSSLMEAGLNVARLNFSHGTHEQHAKTVQLVRSTAAELGRPVAILGDLQGPRIRIGDLAAPREVQDGEDIVLVAGEDATGDEFPTTYEGLCRDVKIGDRILVDDGLIELVTLEVSGTRVRCRVLHGGRIKSHKGMNLPGVDVSAPSITEKDWADVSFALEHQLEYLALSFVRRAADIAELRTKIPKEMLVVSKIEKDSALDNIESIIHASDAVMVARGDLGVELPFEEVPIAQKRIITLANRLGRPVITATQMLESMIEHARPTRAEASDVATAIYQGADAVMLSAESASGQYPVEAVQMMERILGEVESDPYQRQLLEALETKAEPTSADAICAAMDVIAGLLPVVAIATYTTSGSTSVRAARERPGAPIVSMTPNLATARRLALVWGVHSVHTADVADVAEMVSRACQCAREEGFARPGDTLIISAGMPFGTPGATNLLRIAHV